MNKRNKRERVRGTQQNESGEWGKMQTKGNSEKVGKVREGERRIRIEDKVK